MSGTIANLNYILKKIYPQERVEDLVYRNNPLLAIIPKSAGMVGEETVLATQYAPPAGRSANFTDAQNGAVASSSRGVQFKLTQVSDYSLFQITTQAILAGGSVRGAIVNLLDREVQSALNIFARSRAISLYGDGIGTIGQVASVSGAGPYVLQLADVSAVTNFEVGQVIVAASSQTAALNNAGGGVTINAINRSSGQLTVLTNPDSIIANNYLFVKGDRIAGSISGQADYLRLSGLEAWNPAVAPTSAPFFTVDRSSDTTRLGGLRVDASNMNPEEALITAMSQLAVEGGHPSHMFVNYVDFKNIQMSLGTKVQTSYMEYSPTIGWSTVDVTGPTGDVKIVPDINCPAGVGRLLTLNTWKLMFSKELAYMQNLDGDFLSRVESADRYEGRIAFYGQLGCTAPGWNARVAMPTQ